MAFLLRALTGLMMSFAALLSGAVYAAPPDEQSIAFYYADHPPVHELSMFSKVVVEPDHLPKSDLQRLREGGSQVLAYVSIGEVRRDRPWYSETDEAWVLGENKAWNSAIMDMANPQWQAFILEHLVAPLAEQGYGGVFLDTLDSYQLATNDSAKRTVQQQGLIQLIQQLRQHFPELKILLNRGFEVVPDVHARIDGVVAESLFQTWNAATRRYGKVSADAHQWLQHKLGELHKRYHLPVYVIDYVSPADRVLARQTAKRISGLGFTPWVANPQLDMLGVSTLEIVPRHVMVLYDGEESDLPYSQAHRYLASPLEYMGYVVDYLNVRHALPATSLAGKYAGIIAWFSDDNMPSPRRLTNWLMRQMDDGIPIALMHSLGMKPSKAFLDRLGLKAIPGKIKRPLRIVHQDAMAAMEAKPRPLARGLLPLQAVDPYVQVHERVEDARHVGMDVVLTAPWGGMALAPYVVEMGLDKHARWRLDVFRFLRTALHLEPMPVFDTTTENGSRLLMTHIDGDGAASRAVMPGS
ncbi:MAG: endo alpha-1,4 polygalactosaminidase, partial [Mariprofundaceae bacterium]